MLESQDGRKTRSPRREPGSPYWLIAADRHGYAAGRTAVFVQDRGAEGLVLPVFSSEEEASALLRAMADEDDEAGWRVRGTGSGELASVLSGSGFSAGPCPDVEKIALDPSPEIVLRPELELVTVGRKCFLEQLMGRGRAWFEASREERGSAPV